MAGSDDGRLSAQELSQAARSTVEALTGYTAEAVSGLEWDDELWHVTVDVLELSRIPDTTDVIGTYAIQLDPEGTLRGYRRTGRYLRGQTSGM